MTSTTTCITCTVTASGADCFGCGTTAPLTEAPEDQAAQALAATSTDALLTAAYALTHRIHDAEADPAHRGPWTGRAAAQERLADLRAQRDLITAEVLRRTGGQ